MSVITAKLILTGARAGMTCVLGKWHFIEGVATITGPQLEVRNVCEYIGRVYKAFPEGSTDLAHYQALDEEEKHGKRDLQGATEPGAAAAHGGAVQPTGGGAATVPADHGGGTDDADGGDKGLLPGGAGHADTGVHGSALETDRIVAAVMQLDANNAEHWTDDGLPRLDAVEQLYGKPLTRAQVDAAVPGVRR